jgi:hypothetical protein
MRFPLRSLAVEQILAVPVVAGVSVPGTLPPAMVMAGMSMQQASGILHPGDFGHTRLIPLDGE